MLLITNKEMSLEEQIQKSAEIYARYNSRANNTAYYAYLEGAQSMLPKIEELKKCIRELEKEVCFLKLNMNLKNLINVLDKDENIVDY